MGGVEASYMKHFCYLSDVGGGVQKSSRDLSWGCMAKIKKIYSSVLVIGYVMAPVWNCIRVLHKICYALQGRGIYGRSHLEG